SKIKRSLGNKTGHLVTMAKAGRPGWICPIRRCQEIRRAQGSDQRSTRGRRGVSRSNSSSSRSRRNGSAAYERPTFNGRGDALAHGRRGLDHNGSGYKNDLYSDGAPRSAKAFGKNTSRPPPKKKSPEKQYCQQHG